MPLTFATFYDDKFLVIYELLGIYATIDKYKYTEKKYFFKSSQSSRIANLDY